MVSTPLIQLSSGKNGKVEKIYAGWNATKRLYEMGLNTGAKFKVIKNDTGPVILSLSGSKIAIGRGLAQKIMVNE
ncbi:FeoA family protein [Schnuerera sp.]|uniref:FeoA family protein n=1 Tax=Schnuerera sp. TaxID=2794844 RepID=UPI002B77506C|nr:FeoA domain-containing protein [Schnuerera sp.]HSH36951.1 FeoA domain-containing protein [Schnuerera sp.]